MTAALVKGVRAREEAAAEQGAGADGAPVPGCARHGAPRHSAKTLGWLMPGPPSKENMK